MNDNNWQFQDNYREADCCGCCKYARQWRMELSLVECRLHGDEVEFLNVCDSFERKEDEVEQGKIIQY